MHTARRTTALSLPRRALHLLAAAALATLLGTAAAAVPGQPGAADPPPAEPATVAAPASAAAARPAAPPAAAGVDFKVNNRRIVTFRVPLFDESPAERAALASAAVSAAITRAGALEVSHVRAGEAIRFEIDGAVIFHLAAGDLGLPRPNAAQLESAAQEAQRELRRAVLEAREAVSARQIAEAVGYSLLATVIALLLARLVLWLQRRIVAWFKAHAAARRSGVLAVYAEHVHAAGRIFALGLTWVLLLLLIDAWITFVLTRFAYTRPWGERSTAWLLELLTQFAQSIFAALPGLVVAFLIFMIARLLSRANSLLLLRVERGDTRIGWLDADIAGPTRRIANVVIWLFAVALAYPYLPGAGSDAFKGVTVLAGLMLSLGASSVVGQVLSGVGLMYARVLRVGEYVRIGDAEGTVVSMGIFATRLHTGLGDEVSLPNALVFGQPLRNYSRLAPAGQFVVQTTVTIGYATPWRQVQAMLLEAAGRTEGLLQSPPPTVVQTALSDFYAEYQLCAQCAHAAPRARALTLAALRRHVLDVFSENGVSMLAPHYMTDPARPMVAPSGPWSPQAAAPIAPPADAAGPRRSDA